MWNRCLLALSLAMLASCAEPQIPEMQVHWVTEPCFPECNEATIADRNVVKCCPAYCLTRKPYPFSVSLCSKHCVVVNNKLLPSPVSLATCFPTTKVAAHPRRPQGLLHMRQPLQRA